MDENTTYYETLITKYLLNEASEEEVNQLLEWLKGSSENLNTFMTWRQSWVLQNTHQVDQLIDIEDEWLLLSKRATVNETPASPKLSTGTHRHFMWAAAIALLLIVPTLTYFLFFSQPSEQTLFADNQVIESVLSDGTQVALNKGSILYYPTIFRGSERKVSLDGEAFFSVTHSEEKVFIIDAESMQIRVLGTSFYVNTHSAGNTMEVVLISGSVKLSYNKHEMLLMPGDKAIVLRESGEIVKQENKDRNLLAWKTRSLYFNDTPIHEIIDVLEKVYHKEFRVINPGINNCRITATFEEQSLEAVLLVLQSTIDITARSNGNIIELSGTACQ